MIEQCHHTLEGIIKKVMDTQQDWEEILDGALLGMRSQVHASTGYLPIRMLFNINPILPFQMADKLKYSNLSESIENDCNESSEIASSSNGDLIDMVQKLEHQRQEIFKNAKQKIKTAQQHQAKGYNNSQAKGLPFEVSSKY